jgi:cytidyltransferase-like protein
MIVYNGGTYDLLHPGHLFVFRQMRELAGPDGRVVIALNTDDFVEHFKGHPPVQSYDERAAVLRGLRDIDEVVPNTSGPDARPSSRWVRTSSRLVETGGPRMTASTVTRWGSVGSGWTSTGSAWCTSTGWTATRPRTCGRPLGP